MMTGAGFYTRLAAQVLNDTVDEVMGLAGGGGMNEELGFDAFDGDMLADIAGGRQFSVGRWTFEVQGMLRGSLSDLPSGGAIPRIAPPSQKEPWWRMGLYDPDPPGLLLVKMRLRLVGTQGQLF